MSPDLRTTREMELPYEGQGLLEEIMTSHRHRDGRSEATDGRDPLVEVAAKVSCASEVSHLVDSVVRMSERLVKAAAASVLLIDEAKQELFFEFADGAGGGTLRQVRLSIQSGIAGWVARHGRPLTVNNVGEDRRFCRDVDRTTGFATKCIICVPLTVRGKIVGVVEALNKLDGGGFNDLDLRALKAVAATAAAAIDGVRLHEQLLYGYTNAARALSLAIDAKDHCICGHSQRVKEYALMGAEALCLPADDMEVIEYASVLHDMGKIGVADSTLRKPGALVPEEWLVMGRHPSIGAGIVSRLPRLEKAGLVVLCHHEHYDGTGYPYGLKGEEIPMAARLLAVADAFDTMTSNRPYRAARGVNRALAELRRCTGTQFCPAAVEAFLSGFKGCLGPRDDSRRILALTPASPAC